jgi:hypothetical protein
MENNEKTQSRWPVSVPRFEVVMFRLKGRDTMRKQDDIKMDFREVVYES